MILTNKAKIIKRACAILWWTMVVLLALLLVKVIGAKLSGKVPTVFGYSVINIISGSMEDEIPKDSYILIREVDASEVSRGDVICFYSSDPRIYGLPNTHRVVEEPIVTDSGIEFVTRGDANPGNDVHTAKGDRLIGVYVKRLDGLTSFSSFLSGNLMLFVIIGLQMGIVVMIVYCVVKEKHGTETASDKKETDEKQN